MMTIAQVRENFLAQCPYPQSEEEAMAQIILSVFDCRDGLDTIETEIARELLNRGYRIEVTS